MEGDQKVEAAARVSGKMRCFSLNREREWEMLIRLKSKITYGF
jgi:hypothetical protein